MKGLLTILQIVTSIGLILLILIQARGKGFARSTGGSASFTRRGLEKVIFKFTFFIAFLFIVISILNLVV